MARPSALGRILLAAGQAPTERSRASTDSDDKPGGQASAALPALGLVIVVVLAEYIARRVLAPWLPTLGSPTVNDMLALVLVYTPLVALTAPRAHARRLR